MLVATTCFFAFHIRSLHSMSQNLMESLMPDRILSTPLPAPETGPLVSETEDTTRHHTHPEEHLEEHLETVSQKRVDRTHSAVDSPDQKEQEEQSQNLHSNSQSHSPMRQSPLPDNNAMAEQFASISLASTPLLEVQTRSLTPPFWDLSPDEASPSQIASEGPPVASLLLDATQTDVEVVQPKAEDDQV